MARVLEEAGESSRRQMTNAVTRKFQAIGQFYRDVKLEMKRVTWPTREEVYQTTIVTIIVVCFFGYFLWGTNRLLAYLVRQLIDFLSK
jgi:preprotein translocase subunit SecE